MVREGLPLLASRTTVEPRCSCPSRRIGALTLGYLRDFDLSEIWNLGVGADVTAYRFPSGLADVYGDAPISTHVFLRLRWGRPHETGPAGHQH